MPDLSAYANVYNTALVVLSRKGWSLSHEATSDSWQARKAGWQLLADDPMQLLGLVAIHEYHSPQDKTEYWWRIDEPDLLRQLDPQVE